MIPQRVSALLVITAHTCSGALSQVTDAAGTRTFAYDARWLPLVEFSAEPNDPNNPAGIRIERKYTWGLDVADQARAGSAGLGGTGVSPVSIGSAAGIGGLLACSDPNDPADPDDSFGDYLYFYDGGGNVGQLIDSASPADAATIAARYEYDPFGKPLLDVTDPAASGPYAAHNPFRFSTKFHDAETGLHASIFRYYDPRLARWINRDPIGEIGGLNAYAFVRSSPPKLADADGRLPFLIPIVGAGMLYFGAEWANAPSPWDMTYPPVTGSSWNDIGNGVAVIDGTARAVVGTFLIFCTGGDAGYGLRERGIDITAAAFASMETGLHVPTDYYTNLRSDGWSPDAAGWAVFGQGFIDGVPAGLLGGARALVGRAIFVGPGSRGAKCAVRGPCRVIFQEEFNPLPVLDRNFTPWDFATSPRGVALEVLQGRNLHPNFRAIDRFEDGIATSIKSIDLNAKSYQNWRTLDRKLAGDLEALANFNGDRYAGVEILPSQIKGRRLELVIPASSGTCDQNTVFQSIID